MAYIEPGVYSKTQSRRPNTGSGAPSLIPLVIGSGDTLMKTTEVLTRGSGEFDTLPIAAKQIISVGYTSKKQDFTAETDYQLNPSEKTQIKWLTEGSPKKPKEGETYCVTFTYEVGEEQYLPRFVSSLDQLSFYGSDLKTDGSINNLYTAASILREVGVTEMYVLQVKPGSEGAITGVQYQEALDKHAQFIEDVWRIIPVDIADDINSAIDGHIAACSSYEERKERCAVYGKKGAESLSTFDEILTQVGGYASSKSNERVTVVYPASATKTFSDGTKKVLTGQFIAAAYAGLEASMPLYKSKTRATIAVFDELLGVQLTRKEKNKLAECGVLIFEQPYGAGTNAICRHQLTTNMDSAEYRENSILACKDYTTKYLRKVLETYIGKYNITPDTITKVTGSINAGFASLISDQFLIQGNILSVAQDANNPDTLIVEVEIKVPYPCNYIKLTIFVE